MVMKTVVKNTFVSLILLCLVLSQACKREQTNKALKTKGVNNEINTKALKKQTTKQKPKKEEKTPKESPRKEKPKPAPPKPKKQKNYYKNPITGKAAEILKKELEKNGVHLDLENKLVWVKGRVCILNANLEYVAVGERGAKHEALFVLECKPSALNAALLALGLKPGTNYKTIEKKPLPPKEDVISGKVKPYILIHPEGPQVYLTVEWKGKDGKIIRHDVSELIINLRTRKPLKKCKWIYFGGRMAPLYRGEPPVYIADYEQNIISNCYMMPSNHLITIKHKNGLDDTMWWPNTKLLPPKDTPVKFYISLKPLKKS